MGSTALSDGLGGCAVDDSAGSTALCDRLGDCDKNGEKSLSGVGGTGVPILKKDAVLGWPTGRGVTKPHLAQASGGVRGPINAIGIHGHGVAGGGPIGVFGGGPGGVDALIDGVIVCHGHGVGGIPGGVDALIGVIGILGHGVHGRGGAGGPAGVADAGGTSNSGVTPPREPGEQPPRTSVSCDKETTSCCDAGSCNSCESSSKGANWLMPDCSETGTSSSSSNAFMA